MQPIYVFIAVLSAIAAKLIYDSAIGKRKANKSLVNLANKQNEIKLIYNNAETKAKDIKPQDDLAEQAAAFQQIAKSHQDVIKMLKQADYLRKLFVSQVQHLPRHYQISLEKKETRLSANWLTKHDIDDRHALYTKATKGFIRQHYEQASLPILELTRDFLEFNAVENIQLHNGRIIDMEQVNQDLEKFHLNQKLKTNLPPKPKTKVDKI